MNENVRNKKRILDPLGGKRLVFHKNSVFALSIITAVLAKVMRYTIMMDSQIANYNYIGKLLLKDILHSRSTFSLWTGDSNGNATFLYQKLNFFKLDTLEEFEVAVTIGGMLFIFLLLLYSKKNWSLFQTAFILCVVGVLNIFCFGLQKEPFQLIYFVVIFGFVVAPNIPEHIKDIAVVVVLVISSATFRSYYILTVGFYIAIRVTMTILKRRNYKFSGKRIALLFLIMVAGYYFVLIVARAISPSSFELLMYARSDYRGEDSGWTTRLNPWFPIEDIKYYPLAYFTILLRLLFPLELFRFSGGKYLLYIVYQLMLTYIMYRNIRIVDQLPSVKQISLFVYLAFLFTSAAAEPDFGSWTRHEAVLFPFFFVLIDLIPRNNTKGQCFGVNNRVSGGKNE